MPKYVICSLQDLPEGRHLVREVADRLSVGVDHLDGKIVAFRNHCPHAGAPVCEGTLGSAIVSTGDFERHVAHEGRILRCPWHAWEFLLPEGVSLTTPTYRLPRVRVVVEGGNVMVELNAVASGQAQSAA